VAVSYIAKNGPADHNGIRDQVVKLRCMGYSYAAIAKSLDITYKQVKALIDSEFKERFENREELKLQTAMQLDWLVRPLMEQFESTIDRRDAEVIVKILDRKARLLGLDEAVKVDVRQVESMTDEDIEKELARYTGTVKQITTVEQTNPSPHPNTLSSDEEVEDAEIIPNGLLDGIQQEPAKSSEVREG